MEGVCHGPGVKCTFVLAVANRSCYPPSWIKSMIFNDDNEKKRRPLLAGLFAEGVGYIRMLDTQLLIRDKVTYKTANVFGVIAYTVENPHIVKVLRDRDYWASLDIRGVKTGFCMPSNRMVGMPT